MSLGHISIKVHKNVYTGIHKLQIVIISKEIIIVLVDGIHCCIIRVVYRPKV